MASPIERFFQLDMKKKYGIVLAGSFLLWIVPVNIRAPKLITFTSFVASITGFGFCFHWAGQIDDSGKQKARRKILEEELTTYQYGLQLEAEKKELWNLFFPPQPEALPAKTDQQPLPSATESQPAQQPSKEAEELAALLNSLIELSAEIGWVSASIVKKRRKGFRDLSPEQIRALFEQLASQGIGSLRGDGNTLEWNVQGQG